MKFVPPKDLGSTIHPNFFTKNTIHICHNPLSLKNNTSMNAHETPILRTFKLCTLQKLYN